MSALHKPSQTRSASSSAPLLNSSTMHIPALVLSRAGDEFLILEGKGGKMSTAEAYHVWAASLMQYHKLWYGHSVFLPPPIYLCTYLGVVHRENEPCLSHIAQRNWKRRDIDRQRSHALYIIYRPPPWMCSLALCAQIPPTQDG